MTKMKLNLIADNIHYPIAISAIEKEIISTQIFNRLHNILQNSTVYLTYPANRTTRFIHSLGCMHLAGSIFQQGVNNANKEHIDTFFKTAKKEIALINESEEFRDKLRRFVKDKRSLSKIEVNATNILEDPLYTSSMPGSLQEDFWLPYVIVFQSLRLHALMHDIGHPPFSHIAEAALEEVTNGILSKEDAILSHREKDFKKIAERILKGSKKNVLHTQKFHEHLGYKLEKELLRQLRPNIGPVDSLKSKCYCYNIQLIEQFTINIFEKNKETSFYKCLYDIVSSDLDADRLDYVNRDLVNSGLLSTPLNITRLTSSYQLIYSKPETTKNKEMSPVFLPSVRSLCNIEQFYRLRFDLYKYVIFHHRVSKTDGLLKEVILKLAKSYLEADIKDDEETDASSFLLADDISGLWKVMDPKIFLDADIVHNYIQWDDNWLFSVLRKKYFELEKARTINTLNSEESILRIQLEEILSNNKFYYSLFKRVDTFIPVDESFLASIPEDFSWEKISEKIKNLIEMDNIQSIEEKVNKLDYYAKEFRLAKSKKSKDVWQEESEGMIETLRESEGFFLSRLLTFLRTSIVATDGINFINLALIEFAKKYSLSDAIIIKKTISPGVFSSLKLFVEGEDLHTVRIGSVSRIADDLKRSSFLFPPFFIFTYKENNPELLSIEEMRISLGRILWTAFEKWLDVFLKG
jgi:uncharacterized protein